MRCLGSGLPEAGLGTGKFMSLLGVLGVLGPPPLYLGGISMPAVDEGVSGPPPGCEGVLGPLDISGCGVVEPGILKNKEKVEFWRENSNYIFFRQIEGRSVLQD